MDLQQNSSSNLETIEEMVREQMIVVSSSKTRNMRNFADFAGLVQQLRRHVNGLVAEQAIIPHQMRDLLARAEQLVSNIDGRVLSANHPIGFRSRTAA